MGQISVERFRDVVDQIEGHVEFVTLASRGEPLLTKGIEEMLSYASGKFLGLKLNTNASFLDERRAHAILQAEPNTLVFSADAADAETYGQLRVNGDFDKVMGTLEYLGHIRVRYVAQGHICLVIIANRAIQAHAEFKATNAQELTPGNMIAQHSSPHTRRFKRGCTREC